MGCPNLTSDPLEIVLLETEDLRHWVRRKA
jgi:hypothetical protein